MIVGVSQKNRKALGRTKFIESVNIERVDSFFVQCPQQRKSSQYTKWVIAQQDVIACRAQPVPDPRSVL
jgi:hypothetical protein